MDLFTFVVSVSFIIRWLYNKSGAKMNVLQEARAEQRRRKEIVQHMTTVLTKQPSHKRTTDVIDDPMQRIINNAPICYAGDDGSTNLTDRYNFFVHGKRLLFASSSLGIFDEANSFRQAMIWCVTWKPFDHFVLFLIVANSVILAFADYSKVNANGDLDMTNSKRNAAVYYADPVFTALFSMECTMKIIAMGLIAEQGAYLMDPWNWLDFFVVFVGLLSLVPGIPNVSILRTFRVLRPLRSLNAVAGMKKLVSALLQSIPELLTVVVFLTFLFFLYGIIGVQLWSGVLHARCRLTPFPLRLDADLTIESFDAYQQHVLGNPDDYWCSDVMSNQSGAENSFEAPIPLDEGPWTHDTSLWRTPRLCFWPIDPDTSGGDTCALDGSSFRICPQNQTCGSDYDNYGNFRFWHPDSLVMRRLRTMATYNGDLNWGYTNFDHIGMALITIFGCITRSGWTDVMYSLQQAGYSVISVFYFTSFILFGSYFMLNLTLAVIWENFSEASAIERDELRQRRTERAAKHLAFKQTSEYLHRKKNGLRGFVSRVVNHWMFNTIRTLLILLNVVILALDQYPERPEVDKVVDQINFILTIVFLVEVLLKVYGLGWQSWKKDRYNLFDALVVVASGVDVGIALATTGLNASNVTSHRSSLSSLRTLRLLALFKLARSWNSLQKLLETMMSTVKEIGNFCVVFALFIYIYALIGMQTFAYQFRFDSEGFPVGREVDAVDIPRSNFDSLLWSMITVFQIMTGDNWTDVMNNGWRAMGWQAVVFFVSLVVLGNFIVLNLFLAILLGNFQESNEEARGAGNSTGTSRTTQMKMSIREAPAACSGNGRRRSSRVLPSIDLDGPAADDKSAVWRKGTGTMSVVDEEGQPVGVLRRTIARKVSKPADSSLSFSTTSRQGTTGPSSSANTNPNSDPALQKSLAKRSLFILSLHNPFRRIIITIVEHPQFDNVAMGILAISTISSALENPLNDPDGLLVQVLNPIDFAVTVLFITEMSLKIVAYGFVLDAGGYLRDPWNVLDFVITILSAFSLTGNGTSASKSVRSLRTLRALRPLRMINRNPGLKLVVNSLLAAIPQILNVLTVCLMMFTIFSVVAVNNFKGKLYSCNGDEFDALLSAQQALITYPRMWTNLTVEEQAWFNGTSAVAYKVLETAAIAAISSSSSDLSEESIEAAAAPTSRFVCEHLNALWQETIPQSFDNVLAGIQTLFEMATLESWTHTMQTIIDTTAIDMQPIPNSSQMWSLFFVAFILIGSFFVMQLFVGVVIDNFNQMKQKLDGSYLLSPIQREWLMITEATMTLRPMRKSKCPRNKLRRVCYQIVKDSSLEIVMTTCIILNTCIMALTYFGEEELYRKVIEACNYFFFLVFLVEFVVKWMGLGRNYWRDTWNLFDFLVLATGFAGILYSWIGGSTMSTAATTIRTLRVGRLFRLIQFAPSLRQIFNTLLLTLPSLANIGGLVFLVFFIYAAMGVQLFAKVQMGDLVTPLCNFQTITRAFVTLIRISTGEKWNLLMYELAQSQAGCVKDPSFDRNMCGFSDADDCVPLNGCGVGHLSKIYFISFILFVTFILMNIFIAVILEGFSDEKVSAEGVLRPANYESFMQTWAVFDPEASGFIDWHCLPQFLQKLPPPLGFGDEYKASSRELSELIGELDIPVYKSNKVFFNDIVRRLGKLVLEELSNTPDITLPAALKMNQRWDNFLRNRKIRKYDHCSYRVKSLQAGCVIHEAVKAFIFRQDLKKRVIKATELRCAMDELRRRHRQNEPIEDQQQTDVDGDNSHSSDDSSNDDDINYLEAFKWESEDPAEDEISMHDSTKNNECNDVGDGTK